jgi:hypothetical protein
MRNDKTRMKELERLIRNWEKYRNLVVEALNTPETSARQESQFLSLKAELAAQIQQLDESLPRSMAYESHQSVEVMADLMRRHVTLCTYDMDEKWELQDFENTWHQYFIYLNRLRGTSFQPENPDAVPVESSRAGGAGVTGTIGWILAFGVAGLLLFVVVSAAGLGWRESGLTFSAPDSLQQAFSNAGNGLAMLWAGPASLFEPLATAYGAQWGLGLAAALALLSGAFFVARSQD